MGSKIQKYIKNAKTIGIIIGVLSTLLTIAGIIFSIYLAIQTIMSFIPIVLNLEETVVEEYVTKTTANVDSYGMDDIYYTKARMIYDTISTNSIQSDLLLKQLPPGTEKIMPGYYTPKNILEIYIIFRECLSNKTAKTKYNINSVEYIDIEMLYGAFHRENSYGSGYNKPECWFTANTLLNTSTPYLGAFQMGDHYFTSKAYKLLITSYENSNTTGPKVGDNSEINKSDIKFDTNLRLNVTESSKSFFFPDMVASSFNPWMSNMKSNKSKVEQICKYYNIDDSHKHIIYSMLGDAVHRGINKPQWNLTTNSDGSLKDPNSQWQIAYVLELAKSGLYSKSAGIKIGSAFQDADKVVIREFLKELETSNTCGFNINWSSKDFNMPGNSSNPDYGVSGLLRYIWGSRAVAETKAYIDIWFDTLGLSLESTSNLSLVETPGELQGFWTDSQSVVLSTSEMKGYAEKLNVSRSNNMFQSVGLPDYGADIYKTDRWVKFGDTAGTIHYRQRNPLIPKVLPCTATPANWKSSSPMYKSFCGGFSVSMCLSTILHKYINPAEISIAANTYNDRHGTNVVLFSGESGGVLTRQGIKALADEQVYNGKQLLKCIEIADLRQSAEVDIIEYLNQDAMIIIDGGDRGKNLTSGGHYIVIREGYQNADGSYSYLLANSTSYTTYGSWVKPDYVWSWSDIIGMLGGGGGTEFIGSVIMPSDGYTEYIGNTSSNVPTVTNNLITQYSKIVSELLNAQIKFGEKYTLSTKVEIKVNSMEVVAQAIASALNKKINYTKIKDFEGLTSEGFEEITKFSDLKSGDIVILKGDSKGVGIVNETGKILFIQNSYLSSGKTTTGYASTLFKSAFSTAWRLK